MNPVTVGSLDQVHGPCPLGVSGADPGLASQAREAGRSSASELQPPQSSEGSTLTTPHPASRAGVKNCFTALGFLNRGKCSNLRKKSSGQPRVQSTSFFFSESNNIASFQDSGSHYFTFIFYLSPMKPCKILNKTVVIQQSMQLNFVFDFKQ